MFVLCTHHDPDIDGVASSLALSIYLRIIGKKVVVLIENFQDYMSFLNGKENILVMDNYLNLKDYTLISLDCASKDRIWPKEVIRNNINIINIDHHSDNTYFGNINLVDTEASSTAELLYDSIKGKSIDLFKEEYIDFDIKFLENIYAGILFDTGGFRYQNTNYKTLSTSSELLLRGVNTFKISEYVFSNWNKNGFKALCLSLQNSEYIENGKIIFSFVSFDEIVRENLGNENFEGVIDILRSNRDAKVVILLREIEKNLFKGSLRSKDKICINTVAQKFGGGGHQYAAGFETKYDNSNLIKEKLLSEIIPLLKNDCD